MRKTIYVREEDAQLFDRAIELGGEDNLSATIAKALQQFVAVEEAKNSGMEEVVLHVGTWYPQGSDDVRKVKFIGRFLADGCAYSGSTSNGADRGADFELYQTKTEKILVWRKYWSHWEGEGNEAAYFIYDSLEEARNAQVAPDGVINDAAKKMGIELVEFLDV